MRSDLKPVLVILGLSVVVSMLLLPSPPTGVATVQVHDETYHIQLIGSKNVDLAKRMAAGEPDLPNIPNGLVLAGTDCNTGYDWHMDPNSIEFADVAIDECDGVPSMVRPGGGTIRFCPWAAKVVAFSPL